MSATQIVKKKGVAGGGKTFSIMRQIEETVAQGDVDPSNIVALSYNNSSAEDLEDELKNEFEYGAKLDVSTFHSKALQLCLEAGLLDLSDGASEIIQANNFYDEEYFKRFFERYWSGKYYRFEYQNQGGNPSEYEKKPTGNRVIEAYNYCKAMYWDFEKAAQAPVNTGLQKSELAQLCREWEEYKENYSTDGVDGIVQHCDYITQAYAEELTLAPNVDMFVVDEFQDLSPIQYGVYRNWRDSNEIERVVIVGDPAQSIYGFRGASAHYLNETEGKEEFITTTRRCTPAVFETAREIVAPIDEIPTNEFESKPMRDGEVVEKKGTCKHHHLDNSRRFGKLVANAVEKYVEKSDEEVFILARTNRDVDKIEDVLEHSGIPYSGLGRDNEWDSMLAPVYNMLNRFNNRETIPAYIVSILVEKTRSGVVPEHVAELHDRGELRIQLNKTDTWSDLPGEWTTAEGELKTEVLTDWYNAENARDILSKLDLNRNEAQLITSALSSPYDLLMDAESIPVRVGTIHSSKGMEAEASIVTAGISGNQYERYRTGYENEERRLYYVACTRGRDGLHIVHNALGHSYEFPPLQF